MNKELIQRIEELFEKKIGRKTGWGKNEIMIEFKNAVNEATLEVIDKYNQPKQSS